MIRLEYSELLTDSSISTITRIINRHGIISYPTDTLYGLGGNFMSPSTADKIDALKQRRGHPYSAAVSGIEMIKSLVDHFPDNFNRLFRELMPGKFTFLLTASSRLPKSILRQSTKIGIRMPDLPEILELISILQLPLISTSVNRSSQRPLNDPDLIETHFPEIDLLIDKGPLPESRGSTVLDLTKIPFTCLRQGDDFDKFKSLNIEFST
jgi:L-threonylcarbamoyladenylate synthase